MIWLTWRQMRAQTLWTAAALAGLAAYLLFIASAIRESYRLNITDCTLNCEEATRILADEFGSALLLIGLLLVIGPALIGAFWGAPLITRELESGTHRLVWNQSVTRTKWLAVKLVLVGGVSVLLTGALSLMLTWAASPFDKVVDSRFEPLTFAARHIAPFGYAILAFTLGLTIGILARKTLIAMAVTITLFLAFQLLMANVLRPLFAEPVAETILFADANQVGQIDSFGIGPNGVRIQAYTIPGAWVLDDEIIVYDGTGTEVTAEQVEACRVTAAGPEECMGALDATFEVTYQPADRYWTFQWIELGTAVGLSALLAGIAFWRIPRGLN